MFAPSSSPLSTTSTTITTTPSRDWRYPGPSTRFTKRDKEQTLHTRWKSTYAPAAPVLSTERRAHRRTQSSAHIHVAAPSTNTTNTTALTGSPTPPASTCSDYARSPLSRFSSYTNTHTHTNTPDANMSMAVLLPPVTPGKQTDARRIDQDSPFSDYFTDDARSVIHDAPSTETQQILVKLHKLQAYLMRSNDDTEREALNILGRKMGEIDLELNALHSQTRPLLEDSGLFMDEGEGEEKGEEEEEAREDDTPEAPQASANELDGLGSALDLPKPKVTPAERAAELDYQLLEAQRVLAQVSAAQEQLRQRHAELRELNDQHILRIEEREQDNEQLRAENEALKSDMGFNHSDLLILEMRFKALELEVESLRSGGEWRHRDNRNGVVEEMQRWRIDWQGVDARFQRRRSKHRVFSADHTDHGLRKELDEQKSEDAVGDCSWQLEAVKKNHGVVQSITIRRLPDRDSAPLGLDGAADEEDLPPPPPTTIVAERSCQTEARRREGYVEQSTQTDHVSFALPASTLSSSDLEPFPFYYDTFDASDDEKENDCAITTSSTTRQNSPIIQAMEKETEERRHQKPEREEKTAWQELWEGLANVAGGSFLDD